MIRVKGTDEPQRMRLGIIYTTWCKKLGVKKGHRVWYRAMPKTPPVVVLDEST